MVASRIFDPCSTRLYTMTKARCIISNRPDSNSAVICVLNLSRSTNACAIVSSCVAMAKQPVAALAHS